MRISISILAIALAFCAIAYTAVYVEEKMWYVREWIELQPEKIVYISKPTTVYKYCDGTVSDDGFYCIKLLPKPVGDIFDQIALGEYD